MNTRLFTPQRLTRLIVSLIGLMLCLWGIWVAGRAGLSRLLSKYAVETTRTTSPLLSPAEAAVRLTPNDPEAQFARALVLWTSGRAAEAATGYERAASLRPRDYYLWMMLGNARDQLEETEGALLALQQTVEMSPYYAQPRWQHGNVLFRAGRIEEAFAEMRRAALSNQKLLPNLIDLAWGASNNDPALTERLIQPESRQWRLLLARFFARRGQNTAAVNLYRSIGTLTEQERRALVGELLAAQGYAEAFEVWAAGQGTKQGQITNGSFEQQLSFDEVGFSWQFRRDSSNLQFSLDRTEPRDGAQSLRLDWNGTPHGNTPFVSQLVLIEPQSRYQLSFAARTEEIVSGGLPLVVVIDKESSDERVLGQSPALPKGSAAWRDYSLEFTTGKETRAVLIGIRREACATDPCPIFGRLWLDNFTLRKM